MIPSAADDYGKYVDMVKSKYEKLITEVVSDADARKVVGMYLDEMYAHEMSNGEVIDFFCVDTPCIISPIEGKEVANKIMSVFDELNPIYFNKYYGDNSSCGARA